MFRSRREVCGLETQPLRPTVKIRLQLLKRINNEQDRLHDGKVRRLFRHALRIERQASDLRTQAVRHFAVAREDAITVDANPLRGVNQAKLHGEPIETGQPTADFPFRVHGYLSELLVKVCKIRFRDERRVAKDVMETIRRRRVIQLIAPANIICGSENPPGQRAIKVLERREGRGKRYAPIRGLLEFAMDIRKRRNAVLGKPHNLESFEKLLTGSALEEFSLPAIKDPPGLIFFGRVAPGRYGFALGHGPDQLDGNTTRVNAGTTLEPQPRGPFSNLTLHHKRGFFGKEARLNIPRFRNVSKPGFGALPVVVLRDTPRALMTIFRAKYQRSKEPTILAVRDRVASLKQMASLSLRTSRKSPATAGGFQGLESSAVTWPTSRNSAGLASTRATGPGSLCTSQRSSPSTPCPKP